MDPEEAKWSPLMAGRRFQPSIMVTLPTLPLLTPPLPSLVASLPITAAAPIIPLSSSNSNLSAPSNDGASTTPLTQSGVMMDSVMVQHMMDDSRLLHDSIAQLPSPLSTTIADVSASPVERSLAPSPPPFVMPSASSSSISVSITSMPSMSPISSSSSSSSSGSAPATPSGVIEYSFDDDANGEENVMSTLAPSPSSLPTNNAASSSSSAPSTSSSIGISSGIPSLLSGSFVSVTSAHDWEHRQVALAEQQRSLEAAKAAQFNTNVQMIQTLASQLSVARQRHAVCDERASLHEEQIRELHEQLATQAAIAMDLTRKLETGKSDSAKVLVELSGVSQHLAECKRRVGKLQDDLRSVSTERALLATQLRTGEMELTMVVRQRDRYLHRWHGSRATLRELRRVFRDELTRIASALGMRGEAKDGTSTTSSSIIVTPATSDSTAMTSEATLDTKRSVSTDEIDSNSAVSLTEQLHRLSLLATELDSSLDEDSDLDDDATDTITGGTSADQRRSPAQHHHRRRSHGGQQNAPSRSKSRDRHSHHDGSHGHHHPHHHRSSAASTAPSSATPSGVVSPSSPLSPRRALGSPDYSPPLSGDEGVVLAPSHSSSSSSRSSGRSKSHRSSSNGGVLDETFVQLAARLGVDIFPSDGEHDTDTPQQRGLPLPPHASSSSSSSRGRPRRSTETEEYGRPDQTSASNTRTRQVSTPAALICCPPFVDVSYRRWQPLSRWCRLEWCAPLISTGRRVAV